MDADEKLYLVSRRHVDSNEVIFDRPVEICHECGVVYIFTPYRVGKCPVGHEQPRKKDKYSLVGE